MRFYLGILRGYLIGFLLDKWGERLREILTKAATKIDKWTEVMASKIYRWYGAKVDQAVSPYSQSMSTRFKSVKLALDNTQSGYENWKQKKEESRKKQEEEESERKFQEIYDPLLCTEGDLRPELNALPKAKRTIYLRFWDTKAKVCKPFAQ